MKQRLMQVIQFETCGGKQSEFAQIMGWSSQYLYKIVNGVNLGLNPILEILQTFPEINTQWLLFGKGQMLNLEEMINRRCSELQAYEKYLPVMSRDEIKVYRRMVNFDLGRGFTPEEIERLEDKLKRSEMQI